MADGIEGGKPAGGGQDDGPRTERAGREPPGGAGQASETERVDRDALHPADYGSRRDTGDEAAESGDEQDAQQGGLVVDDVEAGGRKPTSERDRDYDPDGDRLPL